MGGVGAENDVTNPSLELRGNPANEEESGEGSRRFSSVPAGHAQSGAIEQGRQIQGQF